jgi:hypothetical protein
MPSSGDGRKKNRSEIKVRTWALKLEEDGIPKTPLCHFLAVTWIKLFSLSVHFLCKTGVTIPISLGGSDD